MELWSFGAASRLWRWKPFSLTPVRPPAGAMLELAEPSSRAPCVIARSSPSCLLSPCLHPILVFFLPFLLKSLVRARPHTTKLGFENSFFFVVLPFAKGKVLRHSPSLPCNNIPL